VIRHVYYYTHIPMRFERAAAAIAGDPGSWLPPPAVPEGDHWLVTLDAAGVLPAAISRRIASVTLGPTTRAGTALLRAIRWQDAAVQRVFPVLTADLELAALGDAFCQLSIIGSYRPPLSVAGGIADQAIGHHAAEACVRRFVLDAAERLTAIAEAGVRSG
jgi:hypothetical protein